MTDTYVPTTEEVRNRMVESIAGGTISVPGGYGELARDDAANIIHAILPDLATRDAEIAAKAWDEGYWQGINGHTGPGNPYRDSGAAEYRAEVEK